DAAAQRLAVVRRAAGVTARAGALARERRGEAPHALDGSPLWFDAVTLAEASQALAGLFADTDDAQRAHDALGLHCGIVTSLLGHCYERVAAALVAFARHAAARGDREAALEACRNLTSDLSQVLVARLEAEGGAPAVEDLLALARLDDALALEAELAGDSAAITGLRQRAHRLATGRADDDVRRALAGDDPVAALAALLAHHQVAATRDGDLLRLPRGCQATAAFTALEGEALQLDVVFVPWVGTPVIESFGGFGPSVEARRLDAWRTFAIGTLHALLAAFLYVEEADVVRTAWEVDGTVRAVTTAGVTGRGDVPAVRTIEDVARTIIEGSELPTGTHWVRFFFVQRETKLVVTEALLDNEPWDHGQEQLEAASWPPAGPGGGSVRMFLVLQGGLDVGRAIADLATGGGRSDGELRAAMEARGVDPRDAALLVALVPLAFGRVLVEGSGAELSPVARLVDAAGHPRGELVLADDPIFDEATWLAGRGTLDREQFLAVAGRSPELRALDDLADAGEPTAGSLGVPLVVVP
ncbi:MAG TPA: DUF6348 family protein, partial [Kofleriaceae bacterium]|nr:DUF6348 family protein [Kofleriaceae bacterium]